MLTERLARFVIDSGNVPLDVHLLARAAFPRETGAARPRTASATTPARA